MLKRSILSTLFVPLLGAVCSEAGSENWCKENTTVTVSGTIGNGGNALFYFESKGIKPPCQISYIKFKQLDKACVKGAKFTATGVITVVQDVSEAGDDFLNPALNLSSIECRP